MPWRTAKPDRGAIRPYRFRWRPRVARHSEVDGQVRLKQPPRVRRSTAASADIRSYPADPAVAR